MTQYVLVKDAHRKWTELYATCSTAHAKSISLQARSDRNDDDPSLIYGEIDFLSLALIMEKLNPVANSVFYDLGHGSGRAVFAMAFLFPSVLCHGIELLPELYAESITCLHKYTDTNVVLKEGDFVDTHTEWIDTADIVLANSTCFTLELQQKLREKVVQMKTNSYFVSISFELNMEEFKLIESIKLPMSWGEACFYIQQKQP